MDKARIQIQYGDTFGDNAGSTSINLPVWLEEAPLPKIKGFLKLAARHGNEYDNRGEIIRLEAYIAKAIAEAEAELEVAKAINEEGARKTEVRRVNNWINRLRKIQESLTAALDKYYPKR